MESFLVARPRCMQCSR